MERRSLFKNLVPNFDLNQDQSWEETLCPPVPFPEYIHEQKKSKITLKLTFLSSENKNFSAFNFDSYLSEITRLSEREARILNSKKTDETYKREYSFSFLSMADLEFFLDSLKKRPFPGLKKLKASGINREASIEIA